MMDWKKLQGILQGDAPHEALKAMWEDGRMADELPEVAALFGVPQSGKYHPEGCAGEHTLLCMKIACQLTDDPLVRFAVLVHDLGKAETPAEMLPKHHNHDKRGVPLVDRLCRRLNAPDEYRIFARKAAEWHMFAHVVREVRPAKFVGLFNAFGALKDDADFGRFLLVCEADARGRAGHENDAFPEGPYMRAMLKEARERVGDAPYDPNRHRLSGKYCSKP